MGALIEMIGVEGGGEGGFVEEVYHEISKRSVLTPKYQNEIISESSDSGNKKYYVQQKGKKKPAGNRKIITERAGNTQQVRQGLWREQ